ncbi:MAG: fibronectin type III domain-containing protein, partial [Rhodoglobus sp.]|nr:fibronectin type III domain-containing protein [Rhodoglobus sp.]
YENRWIVDGVYADGQFGSLWSTSAGSYPIDSPSSTYNASATNRGYLNVPINLGESVAFRFWGFAPNGNCNTYSFSVFNPAGGVVASNNGFYAVNSAAESSFTAASGGVWRVDVRYHYATGVAPSSGTVSYFFTVGPVAQSIVFNAIPRHAVGDAPFAPEAGASSGLPVAFSIVSGPATSANGAITVTGDGTVTVRASQPGGVVGGSIWSAAPPVDRSFTVSGTAQSIVFPVIGSRAHGDAPFPLGATATSGLPVVLTVTSGPAAISSNVVTLTGGGNVTITAAQAGNAAYAPAPTVSRTFAVAPDTTVPTTPENLVASGIGTGGFTLSWTAASDNVGVTAYEVQRNGIVVGTVATPTIALSGLVQATTYAMTVRARDSSGNWSLPCVPVPVKTAAFLPPRLALQYWQTGDYPNRPYGHQSEVWVEGHDEDNDDGSGHWDDQDGDGVDDTWVPDTHWVDGCYAYFWVWDGVYADGKFGSKWATTAGTFSIADDSSSGAVTERG